MIGSPGFNVLIISKASRLQTTIERVSSCFQLFSNCENMLFQMDADKCFHNDIKLCLRCQIKYNCVISKIFK